MTACLDTSFVVHAIYTHQQTLSGLREFTRLVAERTELIAAPSLFLEFPSMLRKEVNRGRITMGESDQFMESLLALPIESIPLPARLTARAYEIASRLNQSDIFDAAGYATAEALDAEFWTSDRRFANAATQAGLDRVRFID